MSKKGFGKFILGGAVGAGVALLFAPQKGSKTRKELKEKLDELIEKAKNVDAEEVKNNILDKANELKEAVKDLDKEKAVDLAKKEAKKLEKKAVELYDAAKEASSPVIEKAVKEVKEATLKTAKEVVKKLEDSEKPKKVQKSK